MAADMDYTVTTDVEWRTIAADVVSEAPRGDVVIGRNLHPSRDIHVETPLLVAEIWKADTSAAKVAEKRAYWKDQGLDHYWECTVGDTDDATEIAIWRLGSDQLPTRIAGTDTVLISEPFAIDVTPASMLGAMVRIHTELTDENAELANGNAELAEENVELANENAELIRERTELRQRLAEFGNDD